MSAKGSEENSLTGERDLPVKTFYYKEIYHRFGIFNDFALSKL